MELRFNVSHLGMRGVVTRSASADWTVKLWAEDNNSSIITFQSGNEEVADLQWSPTNSTVIGTVTCGGRLEIWDLSVSTQKPILLHQLEV